MGQYVDSVLILLELRPSVQHVRYKNLNMPCDTYAGHQCFPYVQPSITGLQDKNKIMHF